MAIAAALLLLLLLLPWWLMIRMPGRSFRGPLPPLDPASQALQAALARDLQTLAGDIGERNMDHPDAYLRAAAFVEGSLKDAGLAVKRESYSVSNQQVVNLVAEVPGGARAREVVVIGAHYDSVEGTAGANDNGSGVVALLALARELAGAHPARTLRLVAFGNEEPPYFQTETMGSDVYAKGCRARKEEIVAMISLETMGYFSDRPGSQQYPFPLSLLYPSQGNFIGFVGNVGSRALVREAIGSFRAGGASFPSEGAALPDALPGIGWSDQWAFWRIGAPAIMVTDTAPFRYPHYHLPSDTPDKVDAEKLARVVRGLVPVVKELARAP